MTVPNPKELTVEVSDELLAEIARLAAEIVIAQLANADPAEDGEEQNGYLPPARAAAYLGVSRQRIHQLTSGRALCPDGRDGRTPLYTRRTLDRYVHDCARRVR